MQYLKFLRLPHIAALGAITACLVSASVAISVMNWSSLPSATIGAWVAGAIALGVEGAKLFLAPFSVANWKEERGLSITAGAMTIIMTLLSIGGIVLWLDKNLTFNSVEFSQKMLVQSYENHENEKRIARDKELLEIAKRFTDMDHLTKAAEVLSKLAPPAELGTKVEKVGGVQVVIGLRIPFTLSKTQHWVLLIFLACTIDLGGLLLLVILVVMLKREAGRDGEPVEVVQTMKPVEVVQTAKPAQPRKSKPRQPVTGDRHQVIYEDILAGQCLDDKGQILGAKKIGTKYTIRATDVTTILFGMVGTGLVEKNKIGRYVLKDRKHHIFKD